jgi:hypothetical protein
MPQKPTDQVSHKTRKPPDPQAKSHSNSTSSSSKKRATATQPTKPESKKPTRKEIEKTRQIVQDIRAVRLVLSHISDVRKSLLFAAVGLRDDANPFCHALKIYGPLHLLNDEDTVLRLHSLWVKAGKGDKRAKGILESIGSALSWVGNGPYEQLTKQEREQHRQESASISRSVTKWTTRFKEKYLLCYKTPEMAWNQLEEDFNNEARFKYPQRRKIAFQKIHDQLAEKYPELHSYPARSSDKV